MSKARIIIITEGYSRIVQPLIERYNVLGVIDSSPTHESKHKKALVKVLSKIHSSVSKSNSLENNLAKRGIDYFVIDKNKIDELPHWVQNRKPDLIIVYGMSFLLKKEVFEIPTYGTLNLHPSLLPNYRGPNPWFWMYYNQEEIGGITLHFIDEGEDTGDIIYQEKFSIRKGMFSPEMQELAISRIGLNLIHKAIANKENLPRTKQPLNSKTKRARRIKDYEHKQIIKWKVMGVEHVWHILRGTNLWLEAIEQPKGFYKGQRWNILEYCKIDTTKYEVSKVYKEKGKYFVACIDGVIFLHVKFNFKKFIFNLVN